MSNVVRALPSTPTWTRFRRIASTAGRLLAGVRGWILAARTERELAALSDWQLKDIGLDRGEIPVVARRLSAARRAPVVGLATEGTAPVELREAA